MALADAIALAAQKPGTLCTVGRVRATLNADDQAALDAALADSRVTAQQILRALRAEGHEATRSPIERHRRQDCSCAR
jgi:hypothetical protein